MDFRELERALEIKDGTVAISKGSIPDLAEMLDSCYAGQSIVLSIDVPGDIDAVNETIVLSGKSSFLIHTGLTVVATFKVASGAVQATLRYTLPPKWTFSHTFPQLPKVTDWRRISADPNSVALDDLSFDTAFFVIASHAQRDEDSRVQLHAGVNFLGRITIDKQPEAGVTGAIKSHFKFQNNRLVFAGTIRIPQSKDMAKPIKASGLPWEAQAQAPIPGILLEADLDCSVSLGKPPSELTFGNVWLRIYSPPSSDWLAANPAYVPVFAYTGTLSLPKAGISCQVTAFQELGADELLLTGQFQNASLKNLAGLADIGGANDLLAPMGLLRDQVTKLNLELEAVSLSVSIKEGEDIGLSGASVTVRMPGLDWPVFGDKNLFVITGAGALIEVQNPFGDAPKGAMSRFRKRRVAVTVMGDLKIFSKRFDFSATTQNPFSATGEDRFTVNARLAEDETIPLSNLIEEYKGCVPSLGPKVAIDYLALTAQYSSKDSSSIAFAGRVKSEPKLEIVRGLALSEVTVCLEVTKATDISVDGSIGAVINIAGVDVDLKTEKKGSGWRFEGSTGPGQEIPVGKLIAELAGSNARVPRPIASLVFKDLALSFEAGDTGNKSFSLSGTAELEIADDKKLNADVAVAATDEGNGSYTWGASGTLTLAGAKFKFEIAGDDTGQTLMAEWNAGESSPPNLLEIGGNLGLSDLADLLTPKKATLAVNLKDGEKSLALACEQVSGTHAAFLLAQVPAKDKEDKPVWVAAFGVKPERISTKSLGLIGSALHPYHIALDKLVILAASGDGPKDKNLSLEGKKYPVTQGLYLQGALEFAKTSFSAPFECRLGGGDHPANRTEVLAPGTLDNRNSEDKDNAVGEAGNNVPVGRTIGPVTFRKARFESRDKRVYLLLDASLGSGGFALDLEGFNVNFPLTMLQDPIKRAGEISVGLEGLSIAYSKPPLTIAGGFARTVPTAPYVDDLYEGFLLVEAAKFQITVLGSYGTILVKGEKKSSLFIFGAYAGVVGGPAEFFVTALALGGGYNTKLALPQIEKVAEFPLVRAVTEPAKFNIQTLRQAVEPSSGDYWLAVGVKFTTYKIVDSFALFSVAFGNRLQFALLGLAKLALPPEASEDTCAVYAELAIRAVLDPEAGVFCIEGQLTQRSFVLTNKLHLTGGFAFFVWFGNAPQAGDFVISLGGYHPDFLRPAHYPLVPRVGINGNIGPLTVSGEAYLALTPSCLMAGLKLEAVFEASIVRAAFVAYADFLIAWAPFHYDARIGIGIAITLYLLRAYRLEASADLHIWGPPFAGTARVSISIISFTIDFGDHTTVSAPLLGWTDFQKSFLPAPERGSTNARVAAIRLSAGLVREVKKDQAVYRIVNPHELVIETDSVVPCSAVVLGGNTVKTSTVKIGIRPMGARELKSQHTLTIKDKDNKPVHSSFIPIECNQKNYPKALWSADAPSRKPDAGMVEGALAGITLRVKPKLPVHPLGPYPISTFAYFQIHKDIPWSTAKPVPSSATEKFSAISESNASRIRDHLPTRKFGWNRIDMKRTSADPGGRFQAPFLSTALGQSLAGS